MLHMRESDVRRALAEIRERLKLHQKVVAKKVGHVQSWVSEHESGKRQMTIDDAHALAEVYGHSLIIAIIPKGEDAPDLNAIWSALAPADRRVMVALARLVGDGRLAGSERRMLEMIVATHAEGA